MFGTVSITSNSNGIPYLRTSGISVTTDSVDFSLGFRRIPAIGYLTVEVTNAIPTGTTATLPIRLTLNGNTRNLTFFGGDNVTAGDLEGTGVITVFYNWYTGTLQTTSLSPATA